MTRLRLPATLVPAFVVALTALSVGPAAAPALAADPPEGVEFTPDVVYGKGGDRDLKLDLARPKGDARGLPCVVVIHGGGWRHGDKSQHVNITWAIAQKGYVAATIGYRLVPTANFPAPVEDVKCAVRYLRAHADKYGLDPDRIGAVGFSAGAHLSMMLGLTEPSDGLEGTGGWADQPSKVQAVVGFFGPSDLAASDLPERTQGILKDFIGGTPAEKPEEYRRASPITYVGAGDAPILVFQGTKDPLVPHSQAYKLVEKMTEAGVPGRVEILVGAGHGWAGAEMHRTGETAMRFFEEHLAKK